ncbi:LysR substrate-binding domain-containing protein [Providencia vermicola]|uniref:LysR family transcriptional regulator n=2 Tax=Providencia TaxID=586 RepID=A0AAI9HZH2_PROST|nr:MULTISPECIES: LysR substrate-binding domain-containing protein [Providencia]ELR5035444.1 LysR family transcriptional regulator [Providencia stuartii]ELR5141732.1 LysR family transcriptional regulator [Providencia stuartii]ELX8378232.1 LysR family transcriptional regulator [Providencia stuartii]EMD5259048.1 LysR family transcriptional regulator [Providencia stuartii]MCK1145001.1 LysR substrate-binding domain-containing protein [Providencia stuartii]
MKLPPLSSLRFFDVAARTGSFVKAADELHVTHSAISRQIRLLEEHIGIELFERRNRAVFLTSAGKKLFHTTREIFAQLETTLQELAQEQDSHVVSISCEPTIAMKWLIPRLTLFYRTYPHITVHLIAAGGPIDFTKAGVDLALRRNDFKWDDSIYAEEICRERMGLVQSADLQNQTNDMTLLYPASRPSVWQQWQQQMGEVKRSNRQVSYEHFYLCIQAAASGQGITIASCLMVEDEIKSGQLIAPQGFIEDGSAYYLLAPKAPSMGSTRYLFSEWLKENLQASAKGIQSESALF